MADEEQSQEKPNNPRPSDLKRPEKKGRLLAQKILMQP